MSIKACYIHLPFSNHICGEITSQYDFFLMEKYINKIIKQIQDTNQIYEIIYIGGGSVTRLETSLFKKLLSILKKHEPQEFTVECNPHDLSSNDVELFIDYGVNRVVLGVQKEAQKPYHPYDFKKAMKNLRAHHVENVSIDIPFARKDQSLESYLCHLEDIIKLRPAHIALYSEGSSLDEVMYFESLQLLEKYGYHQYEISNFSKPNYESEMNLVYYKNEDMHAFGISSNYQEKMMRYTWTDDLNTYITRDTFQDMERLTLKDSMFETIMMGLRLKEGVNLRAFKKKYGKDLEDVYPKALNQCQDFLELTKTHLKANEKGYHQLDDILINFME